MRETFRFVRHYARPYVGRMILGLLLVIATVQATAYIPRIMQLTLAEIEANLGIRNAEAMEIGQSYLAQQAALLAGVALIVMLGMFTMRLVIIGTSRKVEYDVRQDLFTHLESLSFLTMTKQRTGDLMSRATADIEAVRMMFGPAVMHFTHTALLTPTVIIYMVNISPRLTLISFIPMVCLIFAVRWIGGATYRRQRVAQDRLADVSAKAQENFNGMRVVKAFSQERAEQREFTELAHSYRDAAIRVAVTRGLFAGVVFTLANAGVLLFVIFSPFQVLEREITFSDAIAFFAYQEMLIWPMMAFGWTSMLVQRGMASVDRLNEIFHLEPEVVDPEKQRVEELAKTHPQLRDPHKVQGKIEFRNVTFGYRDLPDVRNINLSIQPGETVAFMGPIGSGKTTLARMIPRLFDPDEGEVLLDGVSLKDWPVDTLRRSIGYAAQDGFLFSETILYNISFGIDEAGRPDLDPERQRAIREVVEEVGRIAQLESDIAQFEYGYEQIIGERGVTLSGGQKQRVALARALLIDPRVLILDDSFSAVDTDTEERILAGLSEIMKGRTTILIAHRVSTVRDADRIYVLKEGRIVEHGSDAELMAAGGFYADIAMRQRLEGELREM